MRREFDLVFDLWDAAQRIAQYVEGMDQTAFQADIRTQDAVVHCFERISEGARRLPLDLQMKTREIQWVQVAGIRHILLHGYEKVSADVLWETSVNWVPTLTKVLEPLLAMMENEDQVSVGGDDRE